MTSRLTTRYPYKFWQYSSHGQILKLLKEGNGKLLLDIGCSDGELSQNISKLGWNITCVEPNKADADIAASKNLQVINDTIEHSVKIISKKYDVILLADVIEHLHNPSKEIALLKNFLKTDGYFLLSVPNVAHLYVRLCLLFGVFKYTDRGILDKTHVTFYTKKSLLNFLIKSDLSPKIIGVTPVPFELFFKNKTILKFIKFFLYVIYLITLIRPSLFGYQFIVKAKNNAS